MLCQVDPDTAIPPTLSEKRSVSDLYTVPDQDPGFFSNTDPGPDPGKKTHFFKGLQNKLKK